MSETYRVTMHGESGDMDVCDVVPGVPILTWDDAIKAAWGRFHFTRGGWAAATIYCDRGHGHGERIRLFAKDRETIDRARGDETRKVMAELDAQRAAMDSADLITIGGDDEEELS